MYDTFFLNDKVNINNGTAVAVGSFDGVHTGHRALIKKLTDEAASASVPSVVFTFAGNDNPKPGRGRLASDKLKESILRSLGVDAVITVPFGSVRDMPASDFAESVLFESLNAKIIVCGYDFRFGSGAAGDISLINRELSPKGVKTVLYDAVTEDGTPVSSTRIRSMLAEGNISEANALLGRNFSFEEKIVSGARLGSKLGFPTANQIYPPYLAKLRYGVYFSTVTVEGKIHNAVTNIGVKPTLGENAVSAETHIPGFCGDIYGKTATLSLLEFLRDEKRFSDISALKKQVDNDIISANNYFAGRNGELKNEN